MIDFHAHFGIMFRESYPKRYPLTAEQMLDWMDRHGIDQTVLLALESPEGGWGYLLTEEIVAARNRWPDRFIAFMAVDPRYPNAPALIDHFVIDHGVKGFGEHVNGLAFDDPLNLRIYEKCNEHRLPLVFELNEAFCWDDDDLPRLERCLQQFPDITWVGHGPGWWACISADDCGRRGYPTGPIKPGGAADRLLGDYENMYADLSAGSGYNAMTRDPEFALGFLERHGRKLLFGTDYLCPGDPIPHFEWFAGLDLEPGLKQAIAEGNARRVLRLDEETG